MALSPTLTIDQLKGNIDALQKGGQSNDQIQQYVNQYQKDPSGNYVLGSSVQSPTPQTPPGTIPTDPNQPTKGPSFANVGYNLAKVPGQLKDIVANSAILPFLGAVGGGIAGGAAGGLAASPTIVGIPAGVIAGGAAGAGLGSAAGSAAQQAIKGGPINAGTVAKTGLTYGALDAIGGPIAKVGLDAAKAVIPSAAKTADAILTAISPKLTAKEMADSIAARGGTKTGILGTIKANVDPALQQVAASVKKYVPDFNPSKTFTENVNATRNAVYQLADNLKQQVIASGKDVIYPFKELAAKMDSVEKPIAIKSDATLNRQFDLAKDAALKIAKQSGGTISSLLDARKGFDQLVSREFPNLYDKANAPMRSAITAMRNTMNDFIASKLPSVAYKDSLKAQSHLFTAIDNLSEKAAKEVGTNVFQRAASVVKNHPIISGLGAAALYGEAKKIPGIGSFIP